MSLDYFVWYRLYQFFFVLLNAHGFVSNDMLYLFLIHIKKSLNSLNPYSLKIISFNLVHIYFNKDVPFDLFKINVKVIVSSLKHQMNLCLDHHNINKVKIVGYGFSSIDNDGYVQLTNIQF